MKKILITGSTDGIGLVTAQILVSQGHHVLIHGRNQEKLDRAAKELSALNGGKIEAFKADLSLMANVESLAEAIMAKHDTLDVLINNAGVYVIPSTETSEGLDTRFAVNTIAPYLLTKRLLPLLGTTGRVVNLSSAAQSPLNPSELARPSRKSDGEIYAKSKLALTMWSRQMALDLGKKGPMIVAINPKSFLGSKMVKEAYGMQGGDLRIGADILCRGALSEEFADASGKYFDNDRGIFANPHPDALDESLTSELVSTLDRILKR